VEVVVVLEIMEGLALLEILMAVVAVEVALLQTVVIT
jgi:hypothetical protein